jgi:chromate reductase, NAD(P)H dehydrogenase (quinone)
MNGPVQSDTTKVLAIPGSLRRDSHNRGLLLAAADLLPAGAELELFEELKEVPPYDQDDDLEPAPAAVARLRAAIAGADALLIATPEYNSSIPGQLKNALDWASRPIATNVLRNKPVAVIGASTGAFGAVWAQAELRKVLAATGARVLDAELAVGHAAERFDGRGRLTDPQLREEVQEVVELLVDSVRERAAALAG